MDIVAVLGTGVSGFSFLMLLIGYQLTSRIQGKILDMNLAELDKDKLTTWMEIANRQLANTRFFMLFSTIFLIAGLAVLLITSRPEATIVLTVTPAEMQSPPQVYAQQKEIQLVNGRGLVTIKSDQGLTIQIDNLVKQLREEMTKRKAAEFGQRQLAQQSATRSRDAGFGFATDGEGQ
ncbi:MAG: hypothetical protein ACK5PS_12995 [Desulfopila sp.]